MTLSPINGVSDFLRCSQKKEPLPLCSALLDPHPDSPLVLSAQLEAPADTDLVQGPHKAPRRNCSSRSTQGPEVQLQPHFREPPRCSSRCQLAARATHSRKDRRVANAAGPRRACQKRWQPSARASDNRQCCCGRERREQLSQDLQDRSQALPIQSESAGKLVSSGAPTSLAEIFVLQRSHNKSLTRHFCKGISVTMKFCRLCFVVAADPSAYHSVVFTRLSAPVTTHRSWAGARATGAAFPGRS